MHKSKESGTEIGNSLEFDFVVPAETIKENTRKGLEHA